MKCAWWCEGGVPLEIRGKFTAEELVECEEVVLMGLNSSSDSPQDEWISIGGIGYEA